MFGEATACDCLALGGMIMIRVNGSLGEGGGQILRTALGLSLVTHKPFEIYNIRAGRKKTGLLRQHLTAVKAAKEISQAEVYGDEIGSTHLTFRPHTLIAGRYHFSVGTAGSTTLVLQTILPALMLLKDASSIVIEGGTHNPYAPPIDFLNFSFLPILKRMGVVIDVKLEKYGFYPAGGGQIEVAIGTSQDLLSLDIMERGHLKSIKAKSYISSLDENIAKRELKTIQNKIPEIKNNVEMINVKNSRGPGNIVTIELIYEKITEIITGFGEWGKSAEKVALQTAEKAKNYMASGVPVGVYLADQLMIPFALVGRGEYKTFSLSRHSLTNMEIIKMFYDSHIDVSEIGDRRYVVRFTK